MNARLSTPLQWKGQIFVMLGVQNYEYAAVWTRRQLSTIHNLEKHAHPNTDDTGAWNKWTARAKRIQKNRALLFRDELLTVGSNH